jgi:hypothetical protein
MSAKQDDIIEKMNGAMTTGSHVEFDPDEAKKIGAFEEDALSEQDAAESRAENTRATE